MNAIAKGSTTLRVGEKNTAGRLNKEGKRGKTRKKSHN